MSSLQKSSKVKKSFIDYIKLFFIDLWWLPIILILIDVITKILAYKYLPYGKDVEINGFNWLFKLTLTFNTGAAFGLGQGKKIIQVLFCLLSYAVAIFIVIYYLKSKSKNTKLVNVLLMVILGGDIGNLIDRTFALFPKLNTIYSHGVVDFVNISPIIPGFGIFNFADACLTVGFGVLIVVFIIDSIKKD